MSHNPLDELGADFNVFHLTKNMCNINASICTGSFLNIRINVNVNPERSEDSNLTLVFGENSGTIEYKINKYNEFVIKASGGLEIESLVRAFNIFLMAIDLANGDNKK